MKRIITQILGTFIPNTHFQAFAGKLIYQGPLKGFCAPNFNCYACPLAFFSCPIGTIQHFAVIRQFPLYAIGYLGIIGMFFGRMVCGWICPFGFLQDLMYKIRSFKIRIPRQLGYLKYVWLAVVAILISYLSGATWFCRLCPQGAIQAGIPLALGNEEIRGLIGGLFALKIAILVIFLFLFVVSKRPFCVTTCPLGAIYSLFNKISLIRLEIDKNLCNKCGLCLDVCPTGINPCEDLDSVDCIRCLECKRTCPHNAISIKGRIKSAMVHVPLSAAIRDGKKQRQPVPK